MGLSQPLTFTAVKIEQDKTQGLFHETNLDINENKMSFNRKVPLLLIYIIHYCVVFITCIVKKQSVYICGHQIILLFHFHHFAKLNHQKVSINSRVNECQLVIFESLFPLSHSSH